MHRIVAACLFVACLLGTVACDSAAPPAVSDMLVPTAIPLTGTPPTATAIPPTATATHTPEPTATPTTVPTAEPTATPQALPASLEREIWDVESRAGYVRGLRAVHDVPEIFFTRAEFREYFKKQLQADVPEEEVREYLQQLWLLRLVKDPSIDFYEVSTDLYSDGILGFYEFTTKKLFVISEDFALDPGEKVTLAHEYVHSLQDGRYDLMKMMPKDSNDHDRSLAFRALIEGDAVLSSYTYIFNYMGNSELEKLFERRGTISEETKNNTPRYLGEDTIFPYSEGPKFVSELVAVGGFSTVNLALSDPPRSTEQIMHPEKFLKTPIDQPVSITLPPITPTLGTGWEQRDTDTLGEFDLKIMLEENGAGDAARGAAGWGGGRYALLRNGDAALVYASTFWDTEADAVEFEGAMGETFAKMPRDGEFWSDAGRLFALKRSGSKVLFIASTDRGALELALTAK